MTAQLCFTTLSENDTVARWKNMLGAVLLVSLFRLFDAGLEPVLTPTANGGQSYAHRRRILVPM